MEKRIEKLAETEKIVISDLRQKNEYLWGVNNNFIPVRVSTTFKQAVDRVEKRDGQCDISRFDHESERGVEDKKMETIYNDSTKEELYEKIDRMIERLGGL